MRIKLGKIILTVIILSLILTPLAQAALPNLPGIEAPGEDASLPKLINYIFSFLLLVGTLLVAASLIYGGILFLTSRGNAAQTSKAKSRITYSALGLLILFSSFLLLNTINPQLVNLFWKKPATSTPDIPPVSTTTYSEATTTFQELPVGTLTEKLLAKDVDCYKPDEKYETLIDCQDDKELDTLVNDYDARKGYCYDFKKEDELFKFKDSNLDTNDQIEPITERDRMDCITKFQEPVNERMEMLERWAEDLKRALQKCRCGKCKKEGCNCKQPNTCPSDCAGITGCTDLSCIGKPYEEGDPCKGHRDEIDKIRKKLRRNYIDKRLKQMTVEEFNKRAVIKPEDYEGEEDPLLVADQVRYLMVNFLKPLEKDLESDLNLLLETENKLKNCDYQTVTSHAIHYFWKDEQESLKWDEERFKEVDITQYCKEFNCKDCTKDDEKLPCYECDLDELEKGNCSTTPFQERDLKTCKCSEYLLNNQFGSSTCTTTSATCTMCKIENENTGQQPEKTCEKYTDDPATFYCPTDNGGGAAENFAAVVQESSIDDEPDSRFPKGEIPIGHTVDDTEIFGKIILNKLKNINDGIRSATDAVFNPYLPGKLKEPAGDPDVLYSHPLGCMCEADPSYYLFPGHCQPLCICIPKPCSVEPPLTNCGFCNDSCLGEPCPMYKVDKKIRKIKQAKRNIEESFERIIDLIEVKDLKDKDPNRHELLTMLTNSREKLNECVTGFQQVEKKKMSLRSAAPCDEIWDMIDTEELKISPKFPLENYKGCYPPDLSLPGYEEADNCYPYYSDRLTPQQRKSCLENRSKNNCEQAVNNISPNGGMSNYFCVTKNISER